MKTIKVTHIDTASHGYISVSKEDFIAVGCNPELISGCSGHTLTRLYLEEDGDANYFMNTAKANGFTVTVKSSYNPNFMKSFNYVAELFNYEPKIAQIVKLRDNKLYLVNDVDGKYVIVVNQYKQRYRFHKSNIFEYIRGLQATA